jgi:hypothetical protein
LRALISLQQKHKVRNPVVKQNICLCVFVWNAIHHFSVA